MKRNLPNLFLFLIVCLAVGWLGSSATESSRTTWYALLEKPPLNPPDWVFAPVWTTLYIFMAVAGWRIWSFAASEANKLKFLFAAQLALNGVWSYLFFGLRNPLIALVDITVLWGCLVTLIRSLWAKDRVSGMFFLPYVLWVSFAAYLNAAIWSMNR